MARVILFSRRGALLKGLCQGALSEGTVVEVCSDLTAVVTSAPSDESCLVVVDAASSPAQAPGTVELIKSHYPDWRVLLIVRAEQRTLAAEAIVQGAEAYIVDPFALEEFATIARRLLGEVTESHARASAHRLEILTIFLRGLAHEILNPLTTVSGILQLLMHPGPEEETPAERQKKYTIMADAVDRIGKILKELEYFIRVRRPERGLVSLRELIAEAVGRLCQEMALENVPWEIPKSLPRLLVDRDQMVFALMNLLRYTLATSGGAEAVRIEVELRDLEQVAIRIRGRGEPVWPEDMDRVFVPFYSRGGHDFGEGLSLSAAYGIVRSHHGSVRVELLGEGTFQFVVLLATGESEVRSRTRER
ncbi:MAG: ATP-binding protein [Planctomycetota bacterium]